MATTESGIKISAEELNMTPEEFEFIRKKLHLKIKELGFLNQKIHYLTVSAMAKENPVNPVLVYQLLTGRYCDRPIIDNLRKEYEQEKSKGNQ